MYGKLEIFLQSKNVEDIVYYDFKNESVEERDTTTRDMLGKFERYKSLSRKTNFDCDRCSLALDIYKRLWGWDYSKNNFRLSESLQSQFEPQWKSFGADTMNSVQTVLTQANIFYNNKRAEITKNENFLRFIALAHTIGNFTLVPHKLYSDDEYSFNRCRGYSKYGKYFVKDFFDLSLKIIKENVDESMFKRYINTFYLNDYVDENYNILPLLQSHKTFLVQKKLCLEQPNKFMPQNIEELNEYWSNVSVKIEARGIRIARLLTNSLN